MINKYAGRCRRCGGLVAAGAGTVERQGDHWVVYHDECPEITSGMGVGGYGSDDHNIHAEQPQSGPEYQHGKTPAGRRVCPAGTTYGYSDPAGHCAICGRPADYNPNAGRNLCSRHWDEY